MRLTRRASRAISNHREFLGPGLRRDDGVPMIEATMMDFPLTLAHVLDRAGRLFGTSQIVSRLPDKSLHRYSYRDLHRRVLALGGALQHLGVKPGERVATLMWNHY